MTVFFSVTVSRGDVFASLFVGYLFAHYICGGAHIFGSWSAALYFNFFSTRRTSGCYGSYYYWQRRIVQTSCPVIAGYFWDRMNCRSAIDLGHDVTSLNRCHYFFNDWYIDTMLGLVIGRNRCLISVGIRFHWSK